MVEGDSCRAVTRELMLHAEFLKLLAKQEEQEEESDLLEQKMDMLDSLCCELRRVCACFVYNIANSK